MEQQQQQQYFLNFDGLKGILPTDNIRIVQIGSSDEMQVSQDDSSNSMNLSEGQQIVYQQQHEQQTPNQQLQPQPQYIIHTEQQQQQPQMMSPPPQQQVAYSQPQQLRQHPQQHPIYYSSQPAPPQSGQPTQQQAPQLVYRTSHLQQASQQHHQQQMLNNAHIIVPTQQQQQVIIQHPTQQMQQMSQQPPRLTAQMQTQQRIIYTTPGVPRVVYASPASTAVQQQQQQSHQNQAQQIIHQQQPQQQQPQQQHIQQLQSTQRMIASQEMSQSQNVVYQQVQHQPTQQQVMTIDPPNQQQPQTQQIIAQIQTPQRIIRTSIPQKITIPNAISSVRAKPSTIIPQQQQQVVQQTTVPTRATRPRLVGPRGGRGRGGGALIAATVPKGAALKAASPNAVKIDTPGKVFVSRPPQAAAPRGGGAAVAANTMIRQRMQGRNKLETDVIEQSIHEVVVNEQTQRQELVTAGATLTQYVQEGDDEARRIENGSPMTLVEYKKRQKTQILQQRAAVGAVTSNQYRFAGPAAGQTGPTLVSQRVVPINRVAPMVAAQSPLPQQQQQQQPPPPPPVQQAVTTPPQLVTTIPTRPPPPPPQPIQPQLPVVVEQTPTSSVIRTTHNNYEIHSQNVVQNRAHQQQQNPNQGVNEVDKNSAKMLVILASGEQRLITFTLPKESCTVQDLLEQVGVQFDNTTSIQCVESPGRNIDFVVTVGFNHQESPSELISRAEQSLQQQQQQQQLQQKQLAAAAQQKVVAAAAAITEKEKQAAEAAPARKLIDGFLAVCKACGFTGADHAKCERCKRVFLEEPKRVPTNAKSNSGEGSPTRRAALVQRGQTKGMPTLTVPTNRGRAGPLVRGGVGRGRNGRARQAEPEPIVLTLSSDEEDDDSNGKSQSASNSANVDTNYIEKPLPFEPIIPENDDEFYIDFHRDNVCDLSNTSDKLIVQTACKIIRIGTYRLEQPKDEVSFTSKGIRIYAPSCSDQMQIQILDIQHREIAKVICHLSQNFAIMFLYTMRKCGDFIRTSLDMKATPSGSTFETPYFNPYDNQEPYKRIVLLLKVENNFTDFKTVIKSIYDKTKLDEISHEDALTLLERSSAKDKYVSLTNDTSKMLDTSSGSTSSVIRQILIYPQGKGGISINTEDYACLATEQYLNDIIIDFYLKWLYLEVLSEEQRQKTHIFSTFFYKRLTTLTQVKSTGEKLTAAQKRHARVQNWTKNVNLFEKDFIIIPINEQSHWFLAIICYPVLKGPVNFETGEPVKVQATPIKKKKAEKRASLQIGNTTITPLVKKEDLCVNIDGEDSERDEAEGDESEMASDESDGENSNQALKIQSQEQAIRQPIILIFDSLAGASRNRVVATLRDYLTCEFQMKEKQMGQASSGHVFSKENMPGHCVKVPQQNNFTDCGLFLLQYVEHFFKEPITNFKVPIKQLLNWFETIVVTRKREDISNLIKDIMGKSDNKNVPLPDIILPTMNGELVEVEETNDGEFEEENEEDPNFEPTSADSSPEKTGKLSGGPIIGKKVVLKRSFKEVSELSSASPIARKAAKIDATTNS